MPNIRPNLPITDFLKIIGLIYGCFTAEVDGSKLWVGLLAKNLFNKIKSDRKLKY